MNNNENITTAEELAALCQAVSEHAEAAIVREGNLGQPWFIVEDDLGDFIAWSYPTDEDVVSEPVHDTFRRGPLTVLFRPDQPTEPARVLPSREALMSRIAWARLQTGTGKTLPELAADAVLALFANAPTVEQVKAEAWDEGAEYMDSDVFWHDGGRESNPYRTAQPVPDVPEVGLPTPEVPNVGGEQR